MKKKNDPLEGVFDSLQHKTPPTDDQKEKMLHYVLQNNRLREISVPGRAGQWIAAYPWRFAFGAATVQAVIGTLLFGTGYTNLFLNLFGG